MRGNRPSPLLDRVGLLAGARQHERAGAVGALGLARRVAVLGEQRGLLIDAGARDGHRAAEQRAVAERLRRCRPRSAASAGSMPKISQACSLHSPGVEVEQQRTAGGGDVGGERAAHAMQHPRVGRGDRRRRRRPVRAATRSSERRSTGRARGRCARREMRRDLAAVRTPPRPDGPATRLPARSARPSSGPTPSRSRPDWPARSRRAAGCPAAAIASLPAATTLAHNSSGSSSTAPSDDARI